MSRWLKWSRDGFSGLDPKFLAIRWLGLTVLGHWDRTVGTTANSKVRPPLSQLSVGKFSNACIWISDLERIAGNGWAGLRLQFPICSAGWFNWKDCGSVFQAWMPTFWNGFSRFHSIYFEANVWLTRIEYFVRWRANSLLFLFSDWPKALFSALSNACVWSALPWYCCRTSTILSVRSGPKDLMPDSRRNPIRPGDRCVAVPWCRKAAINATWPFQSIKSDQIACTVPEEDLWSLFDDWAFDNIEWEYQSEQFTLWSRYWKYLRPRESVPPIHQNSRNGNEFNVFRLLIPMPERSPISMTLARSRQYIDLLHTIGQT
jgi:hypothetical protein